MDAFERLAEGHFKSGLEQLNQCESWHDDDESLDGPFFLGFPDKEGWGEGLLVASLLKRCYASMEKPIIVFAPAEICSILKHDIAFDVHLVENYFKATLNKPLYASIRA